MFVVEEQCWISVEVEAQEELVVVEVLVPVAAIAKCSLSELAVEETQIKTLCE